MCVCVCVLCLHVSLPLSGHHYQISACYRRMYKGFVVQTANLAVEKHGISALGIIGHLHKLRWWVF